MIEILVGYAVYLLDIVGVAVIAHLACKGVK